MSSLLAVDLDPAGRDQLLGVAPRGNAGAGQPLGDALAGGFLDGVGPLA